MKGLTITFKPTHDDIAEIKAWLIEEEKNSGKGFYCNWSLIHQSFDDKKIAVLKAEQKAIGFMTWFEREKIATIQITEIKPGQRKKGFGRYMAEKLFSHLVKKRFNILNLHCQPAHSENVWKGLGFIEYPNAKDFERENSNAGRHLYKIMIPHLKPTISLLPKEAIYLWGVEPHLAEGELPRWKWHPKFQKGTRILISPIIFPAQRDWQITWIRNDSLIKSSKIKYFSSNKIDFCSFIIINELPIN